jgi:5,10-methylenetetrahydromethanopterin reductase
MRYGVLFPGGGMAVGDIVGLAQQAEAEGFDAVYAVEAYRTAFVPLSAIAVATRRVSLGPYILNAYSHPPVLAAMEAVDLDDLSGGRVVLGVGSGNAHIVQNHFGLEFTSPVRKMTDYVDALRRALRADRQTIVEFDGPTRPVRWTPSVDPVRDAIPVWMAAVKPRLRDVAAEVADGVALTILHSPEWVRNEVRPRLRAARSGAGLDPDAFTVAMAQFTVVDSDGDAAVRAAKSALCQMFAPLPHPYVSYLLAGQGYSEVTLRVTGHLEAGDRDSAIDAIPDDLVHELMVVGTPADCAASARRYEGLVDEFIFSSARAVESSLNTGSGHRSAVDSFAAMLRVAGHL